MNLSDLGEKALVKRLSRGELVIGSGPFKFRLQSAIDSIAEGLAFLYSDYPVFDPDAFADFKLELQRGSGIHRWWHPQVRFCFDGRYPFEPLPISHAYPQLEWAMNWCISTQAHFYLMLHSAVIERHGFAVVLPAPPGSGKSTLCAALINRGWRLLSDELALIALDDLRIDPLVRPVSLKNQSIDIIASYVPTAVFNELTYDTVKGTVTHMKVLPEHLSRMAESAIPKWVVFPKYVQGSVATMSPYSKSQSMLELGANSFNYSLLGATGFDVLSQLVAVSDCYKFQYSVLDEAVDTFDQLALTALCKQ